MNKKEILKLIKEGVIKKTREGHEMNPQILFKPTEEILKDFDVDCFFNLVEEIFIDGIKNLIKDSKKKLIK